MTDIIIDMRQEGIIDGCVVPHDWSRRDLKKTKIGQRPSGISAQQSMAMRRTL